jgi:hypothetical protein
MFEGQSQRSVASSAQHRQEAEVAVAEERERAATETTVTVARATRLAMAELAAARVEVEAAVVADAVRAAVAELEALRVSSTGNTVSADDDRDNELKLAREATREQAAQWAAAHPQGRRGSSPDGRGRAGGAPGEGVRVLGTELSLSSRGRMTLGVGEFFWFISHTLPQCHALQGVGDTYL